jgi:tripartite-type tricarboxylate transporter receptor subunit TctC
MNLRFKGEIMPNLVRAILGGVAGLLLSGLGTNEAAAQYPARPIKLIVGFGAGGPTDIPARFIADKLSTILKQNIVVENKTGATGMIATRYVVSQPHDGYTLLLCTHYEAINAVLSKEPGYQMSDIAPVSLVSKYYHGVTVSNSLPVSSLEQFVEYAKARPGEVSYATVGSASPQEIVALQFGKLAGISMTRVPFRTGPQAVPDVIAGRVHLYVGPTLAVIPLYRDKKVKLLAVTSPERLKEISEVPTLTEKGLNYSAFGWLGFCAGSKTPKEIVDLLNRHIASIVATPEYRSLIEKGGAIPTSSTPQELQKILSETANEASSTTHKLGLK